MHLFRQKKIIEPRITRTNTDRRKRGCIRCANGAEKTKPVQGGSHEFRFLSANPGYGIIRPHPIHLSLVPLQPRTARGGLLNYKKHFYIQKKFIEPRITRTNTDKRHGCIRCANGAEKTKPVQAGSHEFRFFSANPGYGIIRPHPIHPWLLPLQPRPACWGLKRPTQKIYPK